MKLNRLFSSTLLSLALGATMLSTAQAATLRINNAAEPGSLDPHKGRNMWDSRIQRELFDRLVDYGPDGRLVPGLASSWDISEDGMTYTFHLRDAQWSDGTPITAHDAAFSLHRLLRPEIANQNANLYYAIVNAPAVNAGRAAPETLGVHVLDDRTLEITLNQPTAYFLQSMAMSEAAPLPEHYLKAQGDNWIKPDQTVVSGPFRLTQWQPQAQVVLEKNPRFYDADAVKLDEVIFYPIDDDNGALNRFRAGSIDISYSGVASARYEWVKENLPDALRSGPLVGEYFYMFSLRDGTPLADKRIREALNLATRREVITEQILGMGQQPSYWLVPRVTSGGAKGKMAFADEDMTARMTRARQLMKDAGYGPGNPLTLTLRYNTSEDHKKIAVALAAMWKPLGVNVQMLNSEAAVHYAAIDQGDFEIARYGMIATVNDPFDFLGAYTTDGSAGNSTGYHNADYDALIERSTHELDPDKRAALITQAQQLLLDDYALLPLYDYVTNYLVSPKVKGWQSTPMDVHPLRYISIEE
ncbi:peptide ABC transporter substrate-binding protein [Phytohalomonas tamaricis]|uniref:peptide ABC transporter substrate-binding protein n=1 Tax=Phytohalomonas tamaricis TaxID=2081032 RepID=UPI0021D4351C|nr:peptide ABC transporter substrate-binding protein [Phytohalomonas tamaricis]